MWKVQTTLVGSNIVQQCRLTDRIRQKDVWEWRGGMVLKRISKVSVCPETKHRSGLNKRWKAVGGSQITHTYKFISHEWCRENEGKEVYTMSVLSTKTCHNSSVFSLNSLYLQQTLQLCSA